MTLIWIVLGLVAWTLGFLFVMVLMRMAGDEDHAALRQEKLLEPLSDVMVTQAGVGRFARVERATGLVVDAAGTWVTWRQEWRRAA